MKIKILGPLGSDNYRVENCPVALPKENVSFFNYLKQESDHDPYDNYKQYGNAYREDWHKPAKMDSKFGIKIMEAINLGIKKALNEDFSSSDDIYEDIRPEIKYLNDMIDFYDDNIVDLSKYDISVIENNKVQPISFLTRDSYGHIIFYSGDPENEDIVPMSKEDIKEIVRAIQKA